MKTARRTRDTPHLWQAPLKERPRALDGAGGHAVRRAQGLRRAGLSLLDVAGALEAFWDVFMYPPICEYTIHQPMARNAYAWGYLAAR